MKKNCKTCNRTERKKIIKKLDELFSLIIRARGVCFTCGSRENLSCGHLITRAIYNTRWDFDNAECQCFRCNLLHEYQPEIFTQKYIQTYGIEKYNNLVKKAHSSKKMTTIDLLQILDNLEMKARQMGVLKCK